jgi:hypothetical protein
MGAPRNKVWCKKQHKSTDSEGVHLEITFFIEKSNGNLLRRRLTSHEWRTGLCRGGRGWREAGLSPVGDDQQ